MAKRNIKDTYEYKEFQNEKNKMKRWMEIDPFNEKENLKKEILKELSPSENNSISTKPKIFISHTKADEEFANALYNLLKGLGLEDLNIFYSHREIPVCRSLKI